MPEKTPRPKGGLVVQDFNLRVAELVQRLRPLEVVEILSGSESFLAASNQNQNQNQNGSSQITA